MSLMGAKYFMGTCCAFRPLTDSSDAWSSLSTPFAAPSEFVSGIAQGMIADGTLRGNATAGTGADHLRLP